MKELNCEDKLKWSDDHCTLSKYIQSKLVIVLAPFVLLIIIPIYKFGINYQIKKSYKVDPEWWI